MGTVLDSYSLIVYFIVMTERFFALFSIGNPKIYQLDNFTILYNITKVASVGNFYCKA